jgi:hypothetical protein
MPVAGMLREEVFPLEAERTEHIGRVTPAKAFEQNFAVLHLANAQTILVCTLMHGAFGTVTVSNPLHIRETREYTFKGTSHLMCPPVATGR